MLATLPLATGTWAFDPNHSGVNFKVRHLGLTNVRGRFNGVDAWLEVGDDLASTRFGATIDLTTIDTNQADRDAHLRSTDFFGTDAHPDMTFTSTSIRELGPGRIRSRRRSDDQRHHQAHHPGRRVHRCHRAPRRWKAAQRFHRHSSGVARRLRHRLQHAVGHRQVCPRQEDRRRDRRAVHGAAGLIARCCPCGVRRRTQAGVKHSTSPGWSVPAHPHGRETLHIAGVECPGAPTWA